MNVYKVDGMTSAACEETIANAIRREIGDEIAVEADAGAGEVRVTRSADPQVVSFAIEGAGYRVTEVRHPDG